MPRTPVPLLSTALLVTALAAAPRAAWSAWAHDPLENRPVCTATGAQLLPAMTSDGAGGAIVTWYDGRSGNHDIYAQRISASGTPQWGENGIALCTAANAQSVPVIASDGAGGAIVAWLDERTGGADVYAQRISATGTVQWSADGVALCAGNGTQYAPRIVADGTGGAIVCWHDYRSGTSYDVYAQRISAAGAVQWTANGVALSTGTGDQQRAVLVTDGAGGAIVFWQDNRSGNHDIYAQRVLAGGTAAWTANGVAVCTEVNSQFYPAVVADGLGGAIATWYDARSGTNEDIYAQRISSSGTAQWTTNGVALCTTAGNQQFPAIDTDGAGGAIVAWDDYRNGGSNEDIYAQRISSAGAVQWTVNGVPLCNATGNQTRSRLVPDGVGGVVVTWYDPRSGSNDVYAQRVSSAGAVLWTSDGVAVSTAPADQSFPVIASDGACGAIIAWQDYRAGNDDIYAQRVDEWGYLGAEPAIASVRDVPNDQGGQVKVSWAASPLDVDPLYRNVDSYLVFRSAPPNLVARAVRSGAAPTRDPREVACQPGRLLATSLGTLTYYWEYVGTQQAYHLPTYSMVAPTTGDSIADANPLTAFLIQARAVGGGNWWSSAPDSGYSVDNLAPPAPAPFTGQYANGTTTLQWEVSPATDVAEYRLYRGGTSDFVPGPGNLVVAQSETGYVDVAGAPYYYKLCAVDVHGNASDYSILLPAGTADAPGPGLPPAVFLAPPAPNPAHGPVALRFGLPRAACVELALYDQQGRRVRSLLAGTLTAGERALTWDGCDESGRVLPAGLYFVRLAVDDRTLVSRLAVIR